MEHVIYLPLLIQIYLASRVNFFYVLGLYTLVRVDSRAAFPGPFWFVTVPGLPMHGRLWPARVRPARVSCG